MFPLAAGQQTAGRFPGQEGPHGPSAQQQGPREPLHGLQGRGDHVREGGTQGTTIEAGALEGMEGYLSELGGQRGIGVHEAFHGMHHAHGRGAVSVMQADQFAGRGTRGPVVHEGGLCGHGGGLQQVTQGQTATELPLQLPEQLESGEGVPTAQEEAVRHAHVVHPEDVFPDGGHGLFRPGPGGDARTGALPYGTA